MLTLIVAGTEGLGMDARIDISNEREVSGGWQFDVRADAPDVPTQQCSLKLSFADYNLWCSGGTDAPSHVARAVVAFMIERSQQDALPESFDASLARRRFSDADTVIPTLIR
jgi:hypothetical protein